MVADVLAITAEPLDMPALLRAVSEGAPAGSVGATVVFVGVVRGTNQGRRVLWLEYEAYEPLALAAFRRIAAEIDEHWPAVRLGLQHRIGRLEIGDPSIVIVATSPHRAEAFGACRYAIERVKQIAPIWKREIFEGGDVWIEGATADPDDEAARQDALRRTCA